MKFLRSLRIAFGFLTTVPVGAPHMTEADLGRAVAWFPVVGLVLGASMASMAWSLDLVLAPALVGLIAVAVSALLTGGLHLDGVADVFDALGGGRGDRERTLLIMRDSRIGSHGATALVLLLIAKVLASGELIAQGQFALLALAPVVARALVALAIVALPYARSDGLGASFHRHAGAVQAAVATLPVAAGVCWFGARAGIASGVAVGGAVLVSAAICRRVRGMTGDGYGTVIEASEALFLIAATAA